jgi:hypothetical protein
MVTQLLFGDLVRITGGQGEWLQIHVEADGYRGWASSTAITRISEAFLSPDQPFRFVGDPVAPLLVHRGGEHSTQWLVKGTRFPVLAYQAYAGYYTLKLGSTEFRLPVANALPALPPTAAALEATARAYLNAPYLWGGKTHFGMDCSGFSQMVFRQHGFELPRDSWQQAEKGQRVDFQERIPGDLAFFSSKGRISHVGILLSPGSIIHCAGRVRIDPFDAKGIYNPELQIYTHGLTHLQRILPLLLH